MAKYYITGVSGVGKSAVVQELNKKSIPSFDIDAVENLCEWRNKISNEVADYYPGIGMEWLKAHDWICNTTMLKKLIDSQKNNVVIAGVASNQEEYLDLFDKIFLLQCQPETFLHRINNRTENDFAKNKSEQDHILGWYKDYEIRMIKHGAIPIDTEKSLDQVVEQILSLIKQPS